MLSIAFPEANATPTVARHLSAAAGSNDNDLVLDAADRRDVHGLAAPELTADDRNAADAGYAFNRKGARRLMRQTGIAALGPQPRTTEPSGRGSPFTMAGDRTRRSAAVRRWRSGGEGFSGEFDNWAVDIALGQGRVAHMSTAPTATAAICSLMRSGGRNGRLD
jgi:hypothetical protein